jgi:hypothetical protein
VEKPYFKAVKCMHSTSITKCKHNEKLTTKTKGPESKKKPTKEKKQRTLSPNTWTCLRN